jgi:hypothetical protein
MNRLKSRKLWVTVAAAAVAAFAGEFGVDLDPGALVAIGLAIASYNVGQGMVDKAAAGGETQRQLDQLNLVVSAMARKQDTE